MRATAAGMALLVALALPAGAEEAPRVALRVGTHADHGRLVFDWPRPVAYGIERQGDRMVLRFAEPAAFDLAAGRRRTRNLVSLSEEGGAVVIRAAPGARLRHFRLGNRVVLDLIDAAPDAAPAGRERGTTAGAAGEQQRSPPAPPAGPMLPAAPEVPAAAPVSSPEWAPGTAGPPPGGGEGPVDPAPAVPEQRPPPREAPPAVAAFARPLVIPAVEGTGLAVLRRGNAVLAVLDQPLEPDPARLNGGQGMAGLEVVAAPGATVLSLPLPDGLRLHARRSAAGWVIEAAGASPAREPPALRVASDPGPPPRLALEGEVAAGGVVAIPDPLTGDPLIVATLRAPGPGVAQARRMAEFELLPTIMGAAVLARSDRIGLRALPDRIVVEAAGGALALGPVAGREPPARVAGLTRLLDLPTTSAPALLERLRMQLLGVNDAPPLVRGAPRRDAAETLLALGLPQEAQAMAGLALREDPQAREDPRLILAQGAAALLAGRIPEADGIADPRLPPADEVALWRGLLAAAREAPDAAHEIAAVAPLLLAYPEALRDRLLPMALEAMAMGGEAAAAARLLQEAPASPSLDLARALVAEAEGRDAAALGAFDSIAQGRDRRQRATALRRAAELRLARGMIDAAGAAGALESSLFAWRGGAQELALRRRIAALRVEAGQGPEAFAMLDEAARYFPSEAEALRPELGEAFLAALRTAPPAMATMLFDAHPDLLPDGERGEATVLLLADRLVALDLNDRAAALLEQAAMRAAPSARASIGARLAALRLSEGEAAAAIAALDATEGDVLPEALARRRILLRARAMARRGDGLGADRLLAGIGAAGAETRAELRAGARDWAGAASAQMEHLAAIMPAPPEPLGQAQRVALMRAAAYAALASDEALLAALRDAYGARIDGGPLAEAFALMTSDPLRGIADLPRLQQEIGLLRVLPSRLEALRAGVQVAR